MPILGSPALTEAERQQLLMKERSLPYGGPRTQQTAPTAPTQEQVINAKLISGQPLGIMDYIFISKKYPETARQMATQQARTETINRKLASGEALDIFEALTISRQQPSIAVELTQQRRTNELIERTNLDLASGKQLDIFEAITISKYAPEIAHQLAPSQPTPLTPKERYEESGIRSMSDFNPPSWTSLGYPQYEGKYQPTTIPAGMRIKSIIEVQPSQSTPIGRHEPITHQPFLNIEFEPLTRIDTRKPSLSEAILGFNAPSYMKGIVPFQYTRSFVAGVVAPIEFLTVEVGKAVGASPFTRTDVKPVPFGKATIGSSEFDPLYFSGSVGGQVLLVVATYGTLELAEKGAEYAVPKIQSGLQRAGGYIYEHGVEPKIVAPTARLLLGEERYYYGTAVQGSTPYELLKLGITEKVVAPVYSGILDVMPSSLREPTMFGKSVILPNITEPQNVLQYNLAYQTVSEQVGYAWGSAKQTLAPITEGVGYAKGATSFLMQAPWTEESPFGRTMINIQTDLGGTYQNIQEGLGIVKGTVGFLRQAPKIGEESGYPSAIDVLKVGFKGLAQDTGLSYTKGEVSFLSQARWSDESVIGRGKAIFEMAEQGLKTNVNYAAQTVLVPLKVESKVLFGMYNYRAGIIASNLGYLTGIARSYVFPKERAIYRTMKPFDVSKETAKTKPVVFQQQITQPTITRTGIAPITQQTSETLTMQKQRSENVPNLVQYQGAVYPNGLQRQSQQTVSDEETMLHYPRGSMSVSRITRMTPQSGLGSLSLTSQSSGLLGGMKVAQIQSLKVKQSLTQQQIARQRTVGQYSSSLYKQLEQPSQRKRRPQQGVQEFLFGRQPRKYPIMSGGEAARFLFPEQRRKKR